MAVTGSFGQKAQLTAFKTQRMDRMLRRSTLTMREHRDQGEDRYPGQAHDIHGQRKAGRLLERTVELLDEINGHRQCQRERSKLSLVLLCLIFVGSMASATPRSTRGAPAGFTGSEVALRDSAIGSDKSLCPDKALPARAPPVTPSRTVQSLGKPR
jgi:hypothetical protein